MGRHSTLISLSAAVTPTPSQSKKRTRNDVLSSPELEVDVLAAEPPSKKALRKAKKSKDVRPPDSPTDATNAKDASTSAQEASPIDKQSKPSTKSNQGVWIGNLPWTLNKSGLKNFLSQNLDSGERYISRVHMPLPSRASVAVSNQSRKPQNKGFAYIDFTSREAHAQALTLTEKLLSGRRLLIKDANSFERRREPTRVEAAMKSTQPSKHLKPRIFVGNLGFDTRKEDLTAHFGQCGEVADSHVATFEDSGKCKGYAWIEFMRHEDAEAAVRGWVNIGNQQDAQASKEEHGEAIAQPQKWWTKKLQGRVLRIEFAEDKVARYKKRFRKNSTIRKIRSRPSSNFKDNQAVATVSGNQASSPNHDQPSYSSSNWKEGAASLKPGDTPVAAPRPDNGMVEYKGRKTVFH